MLEQFKIEKGIPIPNAHWKRGAPRGRPRSQQWHLLEVGDSVLLLSQDSAKSANNWAFRNNRSFIQRKVPGGWRVWRVA